MSFDKNYPNRKDRRKSFYNAKAFDRTCRNHGACSYCADSRTHKHKRRELPVDYNEENLKLYLSL